MERKKRSKGSLWEFCYANKIFGTFGDEIKACGQKLVKFCAHTHAAKLVVEIYAMPWMGRGGIYNLHFMQVASMFNGGLTYRSLKVNCINTR